MHSQNSTGYKGGSSQTSAKWFLIFNKDHRSAIISIHNYLYLSANMYTEVVKMNFEILCDYK